MRRESPLDPNHSHFILVDNGTQHQFAVEIPLRARLEAAIGKMQTIGGKGECSNAQGPRSEARGQNIV